MDERSRPSEPDQLSPLTPSLRDCLREDHPVFLISETVDQLDLSAITAVYEGRPAATRPTTPA